MKRPGGFEFVCLLICLISASAVAEEYRTWTSADGTRQLEASYGGYDSKTKTVELVTESGESVKVELSRLSNADRRFVKLVARKGRSARTKRSELPDLDDVQKPEKSENVRGKRGRLFGINWIVDVDNALKVAKGNTSVSDDRPVVWFRVLGELDGFM